MLLPGETVPVAFLSGTVMLLLALAAGSFYVLHRRAERAYTQQLGPARGYQPPSLGELDKRIDMAMSIFKVTAHIASFVVTFHAFRHGSSAASDRSSHKDLGPHL
jgi:integrase